jgi:hypothetical protein
VTATDGGFGGVTAAGGTGGVTAAGGGIGGAWFGCTRSGGAATCCAAASKTKKPATKKTAIEKTTKHFFMAPSLIEMGSLPVLSLS